MNKAETHKIQKGLFRTILNVAENILKLDCRKVFMWIKRWANLRNKQKVKTL